MTNFNNRSGALVGQRVTAVSVSHIAKLLRSPSAGNPPKAHNSFARGAGFRGHQAALEHEIELLTAAAKDKYNQAERTRGRLLAETEKESPKKSGVIGTKVNALKETIQKATSEAAYFDRQALSAQRFLTGDHGLGESQDRPPSPPETFTELLAEFSQEPDGMSLPSSLPPRQHVCETDTVLYVSPLT